MVGLCGIVGRLECKRVLIVGDLLLDRYTVGQAKRISPEAPVAVVLVNSEEQRPGGAGNAALNLISLGASVRMLGRIGNDAAGNELIISLQKEGVETQGIFRDVSYHTPLKNRIIAGGQQIVRVDHETVSLLSETLEEKMISQLPALLQDIDVVAISDYGKGSVTVTLLSELISQARARNIPVIADPKGTDFGRYSGATILKPNLGEAYAAAGCSRSEPISKVAALIHKQTQVDVLMVTRSEEGISLYFSDQSEEHYPVEAMEVKDVTGAGDTVLAVIAFAVANNLTYGEAVKLANIAAGIAIAHFGCARISLSMIARRLLEKDVVNKVFEEEHLYALRQTLFGRRFAILGLSLAQGLQADHFEAITSVAKGRELLLFIRDPNPPIPLVKILASMHDVNYIVVHGKDLDKLCLQIAPEEVFVFESGKCVQVEAVHTLYSQNLQ